MMALCKYFKDEWVLSIEATWFKCIKMLYRFMFFDLQHILFYHISQEKVRWKALVGIDCKKLSSIVSLDNNKANFFKNSINSLGQKHTRLVYN